MEAGEPDAQIPKGRIYILLKSTQETRRRINLALRGLLALLGIILNLSNILTDSFDHVTLLSIIWSSFFFLGRVDTNIRFLALVIILGDTFFVFFYTSGNVVSIPRICIVVGLSLGYIVQLGLDLAFFFVVCKEAKFVRMERMAVALRVEEKYTVKFNFGGRRNDLKCCIAHPLIPKSKSQKIKVSADQISADQISKCANPSSYTHKSSLIKLSIMPSD
jgi:hypothetical protein